MVCQFIERECRSLEITFWYRLTVALCAPAEKEKYGRAARSAVTFCQSHEHDFEI